MKRGEVKDNIPDSLPSLILDNFHRCSLVEGFLVNFHHYNPEEGFFNGSQLLAQVKVKDKGIINVLRGQGMMMNMFEMELVSHFEHATHSSTYPKIQMMRRN